MRNGDRCLGVTKTAVPGAKKVVDQEEAAGTAAILGDPVDKVVVEAASPPILMIFFVRARTG